MKLIKWFISLLGKNPWFTHDKFAHGWLHTIIVVFCRNYTTWQWALAISVIFGVVYELVTSRDVKDSLRDVAWNTIGGLIGILIC